MAAQPGQPRRPGLPGPGRKCHLDRVKAELLKMNRDNLGSTINCRPSKVCRQSCQSCPSCASGFWSNTWRFPVYSKWDERTWPRRGWGGPGLRVMQGWGVRDGGSRRPWTISQMVENNFAILWTWLLGGWMWLSQGQFVNWCQEMSVVKMVLVGLGWTSALGWRKSVNKHRCTPTLQYCE